MKTTTAAIADFQIGSPQDYFEISATVYDGAKQLLGQPLTYTITDLTTGQAVGSFAGTANLFATCTLVETFDSTQTTATFAGQAVPPYPACSLGSVSIPAADSPVLAATFGGNKTYARSTSASQAL